MNEKHHTDNMHKFTEDYAAIIREEFIAIHEIYMRTGWHGRTPTRFLELIKAILELDEVLKAEAPRFVDYYERNFQEWAASRYGWRIDWLSMGKKDIFDRTIYEVIWQAPNEDKERRTKRVA